MNCVAARPTYAYQAGGIVRQGTHIALDNPSFPSRSRVQVYLHEHLIGSSIQVFVNPDDPRDAVLSTERKNDWWVPVMFVALAAAVAMGMFG